MLERVARKLATLAALPIALVVGAAPPTAGIAAAAALWGGFAVLSRREPGGAIERAWNVADVPLGVVLVYGVLFRFGPDRAAVGTALFALFVLLWGTALFARRWPGPVLAVVVAVPAIVGLALPRAIEAAVIAAVARTHELTVDHRMKPDGREINSDGIRFRGEARELRDEDFVILVLGDSFTFGWNLPYEASFPYVLERRLAERDCDRPVRVVNMGWTSASPLLGLRLLREIGHAYRPDLVLYALDATDFHDDIRYELHLRREGDFEPDASEVVERLARQVAPGLFGERSALLGRIAALWRRPPPEPWEAPAFPGPKERYFVTAHPLERTREAIERGTARHLAEMADFSERVLDARMALVLYPRAYQYSPRESPMNWESDRYERLGPYVREPLRYFEERAGELPYPVLSVWEAFEQSAPFPLFFPSDPHWNEAGADFMARSLETELLAEARVPCT